MIQICSRVMFFIGQSRVIIMAHTGYCMFTSGKEAHSEVRQVGRLKERGECLAGMLSPCSTFTSGRPLNYWAFLTEYLQHPMVAVVMLSISNDNPTVILSSLVSVLFIIFMVLHILYISDTVHWESSLSSVASFFLKHTDLLRVLGNSRRCASSFCAVFCAYSGLE